MTVDVAAGRAGRVAIASAAPFLVILVASLAYASGGGGSRDLLVQELLINLVLVLGFHVFIGTTGILSFGHLAFRADRGVWRGRGGDTGGHQGDVAA